MNKSSTEPVRRQFGPDFYDQVHAETDHDVTRRRYNPLFRRVVAKVQEYDSRAILEVGCGIGLLAEMLVQEHNAIYRGFDFSPQAIRSAAARTCRPDLFFIGDALDRRSYAGAYDTIVCTEMLEHVDDDLAVVRLWTEGTCCICSVPNFDYPSHVRYFSTRDDVMARYGGLIEIENIICIRRPIIPDRSIKTYLRNLRWSRNNPSEFLGFLGIQTFSRLGGWFLFFGKKRRPDRS
jgi:trans-aconitate methyltransferase